MEITNSINLLKRGTYCVELKDGQKFEAWYNPSTAHWIRDDKEVGFGHYFSDRKNPIVATEYLGDY